MSGEDSGFVFFFCWAEDFADLEDAVRLELFDAIVDYAKTGETKPLSRDAGLLFRAIRRGFDAYEAKRERIAEARRNAGRKGGMRSPLESKRKQTEANGSDQKQTEANEALKEKEKEKEKVKEKDDYVVENRAGAHTCAREEAPRGDAEAAPPATTTATKKSNRALTADAIARFLNAYPAKRNGMRNEMFAIWERDGLLEREGELMEGLDRWKASKSWSNPRFVPHAMRFLEESWWRIVPDSAPDDCAPSGESEVDELRRLGYRVL